MRIVGGRLRGRALVAPASGAIRPTTDRTRESLFNILGNLIDFEGLRVIDLFAGTGALGIESISRGAGFALFVENGTEGRAIIRSNIEKFGLQGQSRLFRRDAVNLGKPGTMARFDIAFADPPYGRMLGGKAGKSLADGGWLNSHGFFVLEEATDTMPRTLPQYVLLDQRRYGGSTISIFKLKENGERQKMTED
jgi:16S rRNA (guanine966-N2)-methyltransferase